MTFSDEEPGHVETYVFQEGDSRLTYKQNGCFEFRGHDTAPVHHFRVSLSIESEEMRESILAALTEHGLVVDDWFMKRYRRSGEDILAWVRERFPDEHVEVLYSIPYTLNEEYYLDEIYGEMTDWDRRFAQPQPFQITRDFQDLLGVAERDIELTTAELHWIAEDLVRQMTVGMFIDRQIFFRVERLRNHLGRVQFDERYLPMIRRSPQRGQERWFERWFIETSAEESIELGYGVPYKPTKAELEILLEHYERAPNPPQSAERAVSIREAMGSPRWTREWPQWEQQQRVREADEDTVIEDEDTVIEDEDFLRELMEMEVPDSEPSSRPDPSSRVNWQEEGF